MTPELLARLDRGMTRHRLRALATMRRVCLSHGVLVSDVVGRGRDRKTSHARQEVCWRLRHVEGLTYAEIGALLGGRDHGSLIYSERRHAESLEGSADQ